MVFDHHISAQDQRLLDAVERQHVQYFLDEQDPTTHLTLDRSRPGAPVSVAAVGFGLTTLPVGVERGWISRQQAADQTLSVLETLSRAPQGETASGTSGAHGLFYHFLDPKTATRSNQSELSPVDTALLMSGVLFARDYYTGDNAEETKIRQLADQLYRRVDWNWAMNGQPTMPTDWSPEHGFTATQWRGYNEGMIMMLLAIGSPTHPIPQQSWNNFTSSDTVTRYGGKPFIEFAPAFGHQYSHTWIDFRGIRDDENRKVGFDYFENSRRAARAQNYYARKDPLHWRGYDKTNWGFTACDGPGDPVVGVPAQSRFLAYAARGAPNGLDDGTIAPTGAIASLPFAPELVMPTLRNWKNNHPELWTSHGFTDAFNPTADTSKPSGWVDPDTIGIDQGPIALQIENYRSGLIWNTMKKDPYLVDGLRKAGFKGGWLSSKRGE